MPAEFHHRKEQSFEVVIVSKDDLYDFMNHAGLVQCAVDIEDRDHLDEGPHRDLILSNIVLVDEETGGAAINERRGATFDT